MTASFNVPDNISFDELQQLAREAHDREDLKAQEESVDTSHQEWQQEVSNAAEAGLKASLEQCEDPMVHKLMALRIMSNMVDWHTRMGESLAQEDETKAAVAWLRDAGKFQSIINILLEIQVGNQDWTCPE